MTISLDMLLAPVAAPITAKPCLIGAAVAALPEEYRAQFVEQLNTRWVDGGETDYELSARMLAAGFRSSPASMNRHRSKRCSCPKEATNV